MEEHARNFEIGASFERNNKEVDVNKNIVMFKYIYLHI